MMEPAILDFLRDHQNKPNVLIYVYFLQLLMMLFAPGSYEIADARSHILSLIPYPSLNQILNYSKDFSLSHLVLLSQI
jgi:hypothetical protein